ncbi:hypothetical protein [Brumimicrobium mesophilum]|uniref:hypothetical protein n=1 Tax=Brumimicrobium mesophilum TaxID=392717 RepID=UPI000D141174|nr:hypothetical protein [Brumimicrobium mesophilum]
MGIFSNLLKRKNLQKLDPDFGEIESISTIRRTIVWRVKYLFLEQKIEIRIHGNKNGLAKQQKEVLLNAIKNEKKIKSESEKILKEQFKDSVLKFESLEKHFDVIGITMDKKGFELTFQEKDGQFRFFNVYFENNIQRGLTIEEF